MQLISYQLKEQLVILRGLVHRFKTARYHGFAEYHVCIENFLKTEIKICTPRRKLRCSLGTATRYRMGSGQNLSLNEQNTDRVQDRR
jgi:hypothetical protein